MRVENPRFCPVSGRLTSVNHVCAKIRLDRLPYGVRRAADFDTMGVAEVVGLARERVGDMPYYLSIDIDVLDPAFAPGTGTPEMGGFTSRELLAMVRGLPGGQMVGADIVEIGRAHV